MNQKNVRNTKTRKKLTTRKGTLTKNNHEKESKNKYKNKATKKNKNFKFIYPYLPHTPKKKERIKSLQNLKISK